MPGGSRNRLARLGHPNSAARERLLKSACGELAGTVAAGAEGRPRCQQCVAPRHPLFQPCAPGELLQFLEREPRIA